MNKTPPARTARASGETPDDVSSRNWSINYQRVVAHYSNKKKMKRQLHLSNKKRKYFETIMPHDLILEQEQEQRLLNDLAALDRQIELETDLYSEGLFDGAIGLDPSRPEDQNYWQGYELGLRKYWVNQLGVSLPDEF
jgi:hypothetical protein